MLGLGLSLMQVAVRGGAATRVVGPQILISNRNQDENTAIGTTIGTFTVVGGTGTYTFSKTADPSSAFTLTGAVLKNAIVFDYETATAYSVTINANNGAGSSINRTLSIGVNDIDEVAPVMTSSATQTVAENSGFSLTLTADKAATFAKTGGADQALFTLTSGVLFLSAQDFEAPADADANNTYVVQVTPTNLAGFAGTPQTITVTVTDVSDTLPAPGTPTIVWTSAVTVSPPVFSFSAPTDADLVVGDTVRFQRATVSDFSTIDMGYTNTVDSTEDAANALMFSSGTWANGTWYVRARTERSGATPSDWSNTETKTIATAPASTTLDPATLGAKLTLSGGNLIATNTGGTSFGADTRALSTASHVGRSADKTYFEFTWTTMAAAGFADIELTDALSTLELIYIADGGVTLNAGSPAYTIQSCAANDVNGVAIDWAAAKMWIKNITQGSGWNNDIIGNQNPVTGTGGMNLDLGGLTSGNTYYAAARLIVAADSVTFAFTGLTPPSGFVGF